MFFWAGNILLNMEGHAKLADFGVAGQLTDTMAKRNTVIGKFAINFANSSFQCESKVY